MNPKEANKGVAEMNIIIGINTMKSDCHNAAVRSGWYTDIATGKTIERNLAEMIALEHSELSERLEGVRRHLYSDHVEGMTMEAEECADSLIRLMDYCDYRKIDLATAYLAKRKFNDFRADHKLENRQKADGKKF